MSSRDGVALVVAVVALPLLARALRHALLGPSCPQDFTLSCACGCVRAVVHAPAPLSLVCHCDDCRDYVAWAQSRCKPAVSSEPSGAVAAAWVRTVQVFKADIQLCEGAEEHLELSILDPSLLPPDRPFTLLRAHATCCGSPLFNTWRELATCSFFSTAVVADGGSGAASLLQPPQWRLNTKFATGATTPAASIGTAEYFGPRFLLRFMARNLVYRARALPVPFALPQGSLEACVVRGRREQER